MSSLSKKTQETAIGAVPPGQRLDGVHPNAQLVERFYQCFVARDCQGMQACLHPLIEFTDIGFELRGKDVPAMWEMICGKEIKVTYRDIQADDKKGEAAWECWYTFQERENSRGRKVHNQVTAQFEFEDGLIRKHRDECDFRRWARQALGWKGWLLGGTQFLRRRVRAKASERLANFIKSKK